MADTLSIDGSFCVRERPAVASGGRPLSGPITDRDLAWVGLEGHQIALLANSPDEKRRQVYQTELARLMSEEPHYR